ncbi:MAG TPA: ATP-binding protein [Myxococcales bacterium]
MTLALLQAPPPAPSLEELASDAEGRAGVAPGHGDPAARLLAAVDALRARAEGAEAEVSSLEKERYRLAGAVKVLRAASQVTENVVSAFQVDRILAAIPDALMRTFGAASARVWLVGPGDQCGTCSFAARCENRTRCLHLVGGRGAGVLDLALQRVPIADCSVGRVAALGGLVATSKLDEEPLLMDPQIARIEGLKAFAGHPLEHGGRLLGVVAMWSRTALRDEVLEALRVLARHGATAIAGAQLMEQARQEGAKARDATGRMAALLDASRSGVIMFDPEEQVTYVNGAFRRIFGLGDEPLVQCSRTELEVTLRLLLCPGRQEGVLAPLAREAGSAGDGDLWIQIPGEPKPRILRRYAAPVSAAGEKLGWMEVFDDVTHAHELDQMKSEFISTVSHELRSPLTSIKGALSLMLDSGLDEESRELVAVSKRNADRLVRLVNDILDLSKLEAGKLQLDLRPLEPSALCNDAVASLGGWAQKAGVRLRIEVEDALPRVRADADRIAQVLANLLSNALKFSPRGSEVVLSAERNARGGVVFRVEDHGPGIAAEFRDKLFTRFAQADRRRREQSGTGLGLAISRALVVEHRGEIWVESEPGKGAAFSFMLPAEDER